MNHLARLSVWLAPFILTALFIAHVAEPRSFDGDEKDVLFVIPLLLWSLVCFLVFWAHCRTLMWSFSTPIAVATALSR
ncbi:MAG: hypothetical protein ABL934_17000 [Lysobacteraceae bacterium]